MSRLVVCPNCGGRGLVREWVAVDRIASDPGLAVCAACDGAGRVPDRRRRRRRSALVVVLIVISVAIGAAIAGAVAPRSASVIPARGHRAEPDQTQIAGAVAPRSASVIPARGHRAEPDQTQTEASSLILTLPDAPRRVGVSGAAPSSGASVSGIASWYAAVGLIAAAGPALRVGDWRGRVVTVCAGGVCLDVRLADWCQCYAGTDRERAIDLSDDAFRALAPLSRGLVRVTVEW